MTVAAAADRRPKVGLYPNLDRASYESIPAINVSKLEFFERSAAHAREAITHPSAPTDAMDTGTALHCAVLEPIRFANLYVAAPKVDRRTNVGKATWAEFEAENPGKSYLDADEFSDIQRMRDAVWSHPIAAELLRGGGGFNEVGIVWQHEETGLLCKGLLDRVGAWDGWSWVVDLKSTQDARAHEFKKSIKKYHYGAKAAFYLDGCNTVAPRARRFAWVAVEKSAPYGVKLYEPDEQALAAGRAKYGRWLWLYNEAMRTGIWPSYDGEIEPLTNMDTEWQS